MPLSEAEHPVNKIVPLPLSIIPGRTFNSHINIHINFKNKNYISAWNVNLFAKQNNLNYDINKLYYQIHNINYVILHVMSLYC